MIQRIATTILLLFLLLSGHQSYAYKPELHQKIAVTAFNISTIKNEMYVLDSLGIPRSSLTAKTFQIRNRPGDFSITDLIEKGAYDEDEGTRGWNHFYDPLHDRALTLNSDPSDLNRATPFAKSPDWALEDESHRYINQSQSLHDAYDSLYTGLTHPDSVYRSQLLAETFYTLGNVVHHLADMTQPQHVRNDSHCDPWICKYLLDTHWSRYEEATQDIELENIPKILKYKIPTERNPRAFWHTSDGKGIADYTNRGFFSIDTLPEQPWSDSPTVPPPPIPPEYPLPKLSIDIVSYENVSELLSKKGKFVPDDCSKNIVCYMVFYGNRVDDFRQPSESGVNNRAVTLSIYDEDLNRYDKTVTQKKSDGQEVQVKAIYSLNSYNYESELPFLMPRAVAYSAGLMNHFFRGRISVVDPKFTSNQVQFQVRNSINVKKHPEWKEETIGRNASNSKPKIVLTYEYTDSSGVKYLGHTESQDLVEPVSPGKTSTTTYSFDLPPEVMDDIPGTKFRLVYRGGLGLEPDSVIAAPFRIVSGFLIRPNYAPADGLSKAGDPRLVYKVNGQWKLSKALGLKAGNTDWKGRYVDGKPTKVITWDGPPRSLFTADQYHFNSAFGKEIYKDGEVFAVAPEKVLGAALLKDQNEKEWLIAITYGSDNTDVVRRREAIASDSSRGWEEIARLPRNIELMPGAQEDIPIIQSWLFNGDGTEAQTMRLIKYDANHTGWWLRRYKITLSVSGSTITAEKHKIPNATDNLTGPISDNATCTGEYDEWGGGARTVKRNLDSWVVGSVDYGGTDGKKEILGKIRGSADHIKSSTVNNEYGTNSSGVTVILSSSGSGIRKSKYIETLILGSKSIPIFEDIHDINWSWGSGVSNASGSITERRKELFYAIDLRYGLLAYHKYTDIQNVTVVDGHEKWIANAQENPGFTTSLGMSQEYGPLEVVKNYDMKYGSDQYINIRQIQCPKPRDYPFGGFNPPFENSFSGSWLVDVEGNKMFSEPYKIGLGGYYKLWENKTIFSGGNLLDVIPAQSSPVNGPLYAPAGLVK